MTPLKKAVEITSPQIVMGALQGLIALAYPVLIWFGLTRFEPRGLALIVLAFAALRFGIAQRGATQPFGAAIRSLAVPALMVGGIVGAVVIWNDEIGLLLMPVAISLAFLFTFGLSLISGLPMVERFARLQVASLSAEEVAYCRRVTWVWCGFFIMNAGIAATLAGARALDAWALYTGLISYLLMGTLFAAEYLYRHWRFRRYVGAFTDPLLKRVFPPIGSGISAVAETLRVKSHPLELGPERRQFEWRVPEQLAVWPGHFPEQALVPGVLQLEWIAREIEAWQGASLQLSGIEKLKFKAPIFPGDILFADIRSGAVSSGALGYRVELRVRDELATTLQISLADVRSEDTMQGRLAPDSETPSSTWGGDWPAASALLPHSGNMLWLHSVLAHTEDETVCRVRTEDLGAFRDPTGAAGAWLALEWMAQTVAAHDGVRRHGRGEGIRPGMLLGTKKLSVFEQALAPESEYAVRARHVFGGDTGMVSYDCEAFEIGSGRLQAKARLACRVGTPGAPLV